jgi:hypothetical protein
MNTKDDEIKLSLVLGGSREGADYRFVGDEASLRQLATNILARLDGKKPPAWESDPSTIVCEKVSQRTRSLFSGKERVEDAFFSFQLEGRPQG